MGFIDGSALTVALPKLRAEFGADLTSVQWVVNGYVLALAALTLIGDMLADGRGKARMLALGSILFGVFSAACALAASAGWLIAFRVGQGTAAALLTPASLALIGAVYPREERNRAVGVWAAASALTTAAGPVLGGWLVEHFGWPFIFWINPPLAALSVALLVVAAPPERREPRPFDIAGAAILAAALGVLAWSLSRIGPAEPGASAAMTSGVLLTVTGGGLGVAGLVAYGLWERKAHDPMTPPRLVANRPFYGLNLATLAIYTGLSIMFFLMPFDLIDRRGLTPTQAGLAFLPFTLGVGVLSPVFGRLADALGARIMLIAGPSGAAMAYVWMALAEDRSGIAGVLGPMAVLGLSFAVLIAPLTASVLSSVPASDEGLASGVNNAAARIAQLIGVAFAAGIGSFAVGRELGLFAGAALSLAGAAIVATMLPRKATSS